VNGIVRRIALRENSLLLGEGEILPAFADGGKKLAGIEFGSLFSRFWRDSHCRKF
jgi:hypothetical protein